jgi:uncharacterized protein (DUF697 family)
MTEETVSAIEVQRPAKAMAIVKRNMIWSAGVGLVPVPMIELVAITAVELKLIKELADLYETPFRDDLAKSAIIALVGSLGSVTLGQMAAVTALRFIPFIGVPMALASVSAVSAGVTYGIGKVFTSHFELGGTLLDFDAAKVREFFKAEYANGVKEAAAATAGGGSPKMATK